MATKRRRTARRRSTRAKSTPAKPIRITVVNLKRGKPGSRAQLQRILKRASSAKVGFVVLNAPFKLGAAS